MVRYIYKRKGFTLVELLIGMIIVGMIVAGALAIYIMSITAWKEGGVQIMLQREGSIAMEKMVRGLGGTDGIREASSVTVSGYGTKIQYKSGVDNQTRSFEFKSGYGKIYYDPDISTASDEFSIAENVSGLIFTYITGYGIVAINLEMKEEVLDNEINLDLATQVKLRN